MFIDFFILFFLANPFGLVFLLTVLVGAEYLVVKSITKDNVHAELVQWVMRLGLYSHQSSGQANLQPIHVPIKETKSKARKQKLAI